MKGLSYTVNGKRILMKCHSAHCGATLPEVLAALNGATPDDEAVNITVKKKSVQSNGQTPNQPTTGGMEWWVNKTGVTEDVWNSLGCEEHQGGVVFYFGERNVAKIRNPPKDIIWTPKNADAPPFWPMPDAELPEEVWITEGESDGGTATAAGHYALAVTKGAGTALPEGWAEALRDRGCQRIVLCGDIDKSGKEFRRTLEKEAIDAGLDVSTVHLELALDPFTGETDLNNLWHACEFDVAAFNAAAANVTHAISNRYEVLTYDDLVQHADEVVDWLIPDLISPGDKILISGPQKSFKTYIALGLTRALIQASNFLERAEWKAARPCNVMFVQEEGSRSAWAKRIRRMGLTKKEAKRFTSWHRQGIRFTDSSSIDSVIAVCKQNEVDVLFLDPMQRMIPGVNENDSSETGIVWDEVFRLQHALPDLVVVVLHHANKGERLTWESVRGSSRHAGEVDLGIFCHKDPLEDHSVRISYDGRDVPQYLGTGEYFSAKVEISHDDDKEHAFVIDAREIAVSVKNPTHEAGVKNRDAIKEMIADDVHPTRKQIIDALDISESTARTHLEALVKDGEVTEHDHGPGKAKTYTVEEGE